MYKKINYMAYTDFIAAIDLGTSRIVGMVGKKNEYGVLSIIAYEVETSASCIRRGCVYNVEETANKIKRLILKLENKLNGTKIAKVYVCMRKAQESFSLSQQKKRKNKLNHCVYLTYHERLHLKGTLEEKKKED